MKTPVLIPLLKKELLMTMRNKLVIAVVILLPLGIMLFMPLVANLDVRNVGVAVVDLDRSQLSRRMISDFGAGDNLTLAGVCGTHDEAMVMIEQGTADVLITIPAGYSRELVEGLSPKINIEANGVNATKGNLGSQYAAKSLMNTLMRYQADAGVPIPPETVSVLNRYNPTLNYRNYMIPALMVMLIIVIGGFMPAINIVGEKESGTIEAMNVTPVSKSAFVLSKLIPIWLVSLLVATIGLLIGWAVYGLWPLGSVGIFFLASGLFGLGMAGLGIAVSNKSATVMQAVFVMFAIVLIFNLMCGLYTPIGSMPEWAQIITYGVPPRYFIEVVRAIYLKGTPIAELWPQFTALAVFAAFFMLLAAVTYKKRS